MPIPKADGSELRAAEQVYVAELAGGIAVAGCVQVLPPSVETLIPARLLAARPSKNDVAYTCIADDASTSQTTFARCVFSRLQFRPLFVVL